MKRRKVREYNKGKEETEMKSTSMRKRLVKEYQYGGRARWRRTRLRK